MPSVVARAVLHPPLCMVLLKIDQLVPNFTEARVNVVDEIPGSNESCFVDLLRAACVAFQ